MHTNNIITHFLIAYYHSLVEWCYSATVTLLVADKPQSVQIFRNWFSRVGDFIAKREGLIYFALSILVSLLVIVLVVVVLFLLIFQKNSKVNIGIYDHFICWLRAGRVPQSIINESQSILDALDADDVEVERPIRRRNHDVKIAIEAADFAKSQKFFKVRSVANEAIIHHIIRGFLVENNVRFKDMARVLPIAVALAFIPNESEIFAKQLMATPLFVNRVEDLSRDYYSRETPWIGNWFGRKVKPRPIPVA